MQFDDSTLGGVFETEHAGSRASETTPPAAPSRCDPVCITCSDQGVTARIVAIGGDGEATVDTGSTIEGVNVELIDSAAIDDVVLIHAKVAIAKLARTP
jgi:hydrogenase maturation factor